MQDFNNLKQWLTEKLRLRGWTVDDLADTTRLNRSTLYHYLTDRSRPTVSTMQKICAALEIPIEEGLAQFTQRKSGRRAIISDSV